MMWPFKWKLSACTLTWWYFLFAKILENEIWKFGQNLPLATFCSERINFLSGFYLSLGFNGHFVIPNLADFRHTAPLEVRLPMLRLGFGGCWSLLLLVAWSYKSAFLVKYCVKYLDTRLFKHLKTRMHLWKLDLTSLAHRKFHLRCSSVIEFELHGSIGGVTLCNTLLRFPPTQHQHSQIMAARVMCILFRGFQREAWSFTRQKP